MHEGQENTLVLATIQGFGEITMCACGVIGVHLGNTTIRLESPALLQVEQLIQTALDSLCEIAANAREAAPAPAAVLQ